MALGPGRYDDLCTEVREKAQAEGAVLIVMGGRVGSGFSAQLTERDMRVVPGILRDVAQQIEDGMKGENEPDTHYPI